MEGYLAPLTLDHGHQRLQHEDVDSLNPADATAWDHPAVVRTVSGQREKS